MRKVSMKIEFDKAVTMSAVVLLLNYQCFLFRIGLHVLLASRFVSDCSSLRSDTYTLAAWCSRHTSQ